MYFNGYDIYMFMRKNVMIVMNISINTLSLYLTPFQELSTAVSKEHYCLRTTWQSNVIRWSRFRFFVVCDVINIVFFVKFLLFFSLYYLHYAIPTWCHFKQAHLYLSSYIDKYLQYMLRILYTCICIFSVTYIQHNIKYSMLVFAQIVHSMFVQKC